MNTAMMLVIIASSVWIYFDAKSIGIKKGNVTGFFDLGPLGWALCTLLIWIVAFPLYLLKRGDLRVSAQGKNKRHKISETTYEQSTGAKVSKYIAVGWSVFCLVGTVSSVIGLGSASADLTNEYEMAGFAMGSTFVLGAWFIAWLVIAVPATIIFLLTGKKTAVSYSEQPHAEEDLMPCPFCAEMIKKEAKLCRYCKMEIKQDEKKFSLKQASTQKARPDWINRAKNYFKDGEHKEAVAAFSEAIASDKNNGDLYYMRAVAYSKLADRQHAADDLKRAAEYGCQKAKAYLDKNGMA